MSVKFHFLNVGCGDCTIIHFPARTCGEQNIDERIMMIDLYTHEGHNSFEDIVAYYKINFKNQDETIKPIFRFVCSHPHQDHICGLEKLFNDNHIKILNFWDLDHSFEPTDFEGHPTHEDDWNAYKKLGGAPSPAVVLRNTRETKPAQFWDESGDRITVLSPSEGLIKYAHYKEDGTKRDADAVEIDEMSYALAIRINNRSVIIAGDGRATPTWDDIYENCKDSLKKCWVLKAGHHGQESAFHEDAVKYMNPVYIIFSNSEDENKANGAERQYIKACPDATILNTWEGTVVMEIPFDINQHIQYRQL